VSQNIPPPKEKQKQAEDWQGRKQGLVINTDAIINIFNGRRKALKKALQTERNEQYLEVLTLNYDEETIEKKFSIPKENAMGFLYYAVGDQEVIAAIKAKNSTLTEALMAELALKYLDLLSEE
jgi:ribosomal protein L9